MASVGVTFTPPSRRLQVVDWHIWHGRSKDDQDPATWQPSLSSFRCTYARAWIQVTSAPPP
jgi:hypothetical protein